MACALPGHHGGEKIMWLGNASASSVIPLDPRSSHIFHKRLVLDILSLLISVLCDFVVCSVHPGTSSVAPLRVSSNVFPFLRGDFYQVFKTRVICDFTTI